MATPNDIYDELREISPVLHDLKKAVRRPDVPTGYFENLADNIMAQVSEPAAGMLSGLGRPSRPAVPDAYFDTLADQVMYKIRAQEETIGQGRLQADKTNIRVLYFRRLAVAATVAGIIALGFLLFQRQTGAVNGCEDGIACLTREEIRQYVQDHADEFDAEQIHEAFHPEIDAEALASPVAEEETAGAPAVNEEQIEKYIEENPAVIDFEDPSMDIF